MTTSAARRRDGAEQFGTHQTLKNNSLTIIKKEKKNL